MNCGLPSGVSFYFLVIVAALAFNEISQAVTLPEDFSTTQGTNGVFYEEIGDSRSTNVVNPAPHGAVPMASGLSPGGNPRYTNGVYPHIQHQVAASSGPFMNLHPGTGGYNFGTGTANIGAGIQFQAIDDGMYRFAGDIARRNPSMIHGNGVDVLVVEQLDLDNPLFETHIDSNHAVDLDNPFIGTGVVSFDVDVPLLRGESVRLVVFADGQGQDGTYDSTAFRGSMVAYRRGDADLDRDVDTTDFDRLAHFFDASGRFGPNEWREGNFDGDNDIDITDFNFLASNFAPDGYGTSAIPEPSAMLLALLGLILLGRAPVK